jgi:hypothetical protein
VPVVTATFFYLLGTCIFVAGLWHSLNRYTNIEEVNVPPPVQKRNNMAVAQQGNKKRRKVNSTCFSSETFLNPLVVRQL